MPQPTSEQIAELEAKHHDITVAAGPTDDDGEPIYWAVLRKATRAEYVRWRALNSNPETEPGAQEQLFRMVCVWPDVEDLLNRFPAAAEYYGKVLQRMVGLTGKTAAK